MELVLILFGLWLPLMVTLIWVLYHLLQLRRDFFTLRDDLL